MTKLNALLTVLGALLLFAALTLNLAIGVHDFVDQKNAPTQLATEFVVNAQPTWITKMFIVSFFLIASGIVMEAVRMARLWFIR